MSVAESLVVRVVVAVLLVIGGLAAIAEMSPGGAAAAAPAAAATEEACDGRLGDFVWHDKNNNGLQDAGEPGIPGVRVRLIGWQGGDAVFPSITSSTGHYQFRGLCTGDYFVKVDDATLPPGFRPTLRNALGPDPNLTIPNDSSDSPVFVRVLGSDIPGEPPTDNQTIDFGYTADCTGEIGDFVWNDLNDNGLQEGGEPGISGVKLILKKAGDPDRQTTTDANGTYRFTGLCAGTYTVEVVPPAGFDPSPTDVGANDAIDSDESPVTVDLPADNVKNLTIDFGFNQAGQLICPTTDTSGKNPVGLLFVSVDPSTGNVKVRYDQSRTVNDNSYGANIVNWPKSHSFSNLTGSDKVQLQFKDAAGTLVLDIFVDYLSSASGTPSGFKSLGVSGGEGKVARGNKLWVLSATTSLARNLNEKGFCSGGNCTFAGVNLLVNSPPADSNYNVLNPAFSAWDFTNSYEVEVSGVAFGKVGFGSVIVKSLHNSPQKIGSFTPTPCPTGGQPPSGGNLCRGGDNPKTITLEYSGAGCSATQHSQDASKVTCTDFVNPSTWPTSVRIEAMDKANPNDGGALVWFAGPVAKGASFTMNATFASKTAVSNDTYLHVFTSTRTQLLETVKFHTSCSQPLVAGDKYGSFKLVGIGY